MAKYYSQKDIDEFKECFNLYSKKGIVDTPGLLRFVMRSLGYSPTVEESELLFKIKGKKYDFAAFLEILHDYSQKDQPSLEVLSGFRSHDRQKRGLISAKELKSILTGIGERLTPQEVDAILREANVPPNGSVKYEDFIKVVSTPLPDYY